MTELLSFGALVLITSGVTEVIKRAGLPKRFLPLVALAVGFLINLIGSFTLTPLSVLTGLAVGLSASGLFDLTKVVKK